MGIEAPEMAEQLARQGHYSPLPCHDMWAFGLLLLWLLGGERSDAHAKAVLDGPEAPLGYVQSLCHRGTDTYISQVSHMDSIVALTS